MSKYVLDASAVLALLNRETGHDRVETVLADSVIGAVNFCEVMGKLMEAGLSEKEARESLDLLNLEIIPFDADMAHLAAALRLTTRKLGLSIGDRSCLALGLARRLTVVTAERTWAKLRTDVKMQMIR